MPFGYQRTRTTENGVGSVVAGSLVKRERPHKRGKKRLRPFTVDGVGLRSKAPSFEVDGDGAIEGKYRPKPTTMSGACLKQAVRSKRNPN